MGDLIFHFLLFEEKIIFKSYLIKSSHIVPRKNKVHTYGELVFAPYYSATLLVAKIGSNSHVHSMYVRFLWLGPYLGLLNIKVGLEEHNKV
jgi:hypothetical protein